MPRDAVLSGWSSAVQSCSAPAHDRAPAGYEAPMGFDQPLTVALVDECDLVRDGMATMLAGHARRVTVLPAQHHPRGPVDIALVDPFTRPARDPDGPSTVRPAAGT